MRDALVFVVPMPETLTNGARGRSRHWRSAHTEKRAYWQRLDAIQAVGRLAGGGWCGFVIPPPPARPLRRALLTSSMVLRGGMDDENAAARHKPLLDWLVTRGYLATDRRERKKDGASCRWTAFPDQRVTRAADDPPRIHLTVALVDPLTSEGR